ncbi:uncharacterized protein LODBEIA_P16940 [Lodderomyces beijingensis]|uniref:Essential protein Yae1 N-terminal domain-containing protein n=1 Tax=Lodderomyces beijingensis TaxID=1775926 RepID=A0ABP0ZMH8_9ASCO
MSAENDNVEIDIDEVLNLEEESYKLGFDEGTAENAKQQLMEGKQYGYQTGFQRFLIVGYMQGLVIDWEEQAHAYSNWAQIEPRVKSLRSLVFDIPTSNGDDEVVEFETKLHKARNKLSVVVGLTKEQWKVPVLDELAKEIGGELQVSENLDEMW